MTNPTVGAPSSIRRLLDSTRFPVIKATEVRSRIEEAMLEFDPFVIEGDLVLYWSPGGDSWCIGTLEVADLVARHFSIERAEHSGNRHVGRVRIIIEKLPDASND